MARVKITEEQKAQICAMVSVGCSLRAAARLAACHESTVRSRLQNDKAFLARYRKSEQASELIALRHVQTAGAKNWRAAAWLLERMRPNEYATPKPDTLRPDDFAQLTSTVAELVLREVKNPEECRKISEGLQSIEDQMTSLFLDYKRDRIYGVRRKPRKTDKPA